MSPAAPNPEVDIVDLGNGEWRVLGPSPEACTLAATELLGEVSILRATRKTSALRRGGPRVELVVKPVRPTPVDESRQSVSLEDFASRTAQRLSQSQSAESAAPSTSAYPPNPAPSRSSSQDNDDEQEMTRDLMSFYAKDASKVSPLELPLPAPRTSPYDQGVTSPTPFQRVPGAARPAAPDRSSIRVQQYDRLITDPRAGIPRPDSSPGGESLKPPADPAANLAPAIDLYSQEGLSEEQQREVLARLHPLDYDQAAHGGLSRPNELVDWSRSMLREVGVPLQVMRRFPVDDPSTPAGWVRMLERVFTRVLGEAITPTDVSVIPEGVSGAVDILRVAVLTGTRIPLLNVEGRIAPATPALLVEVISSAMPTLQQWPVLDMESAQSEKVFDALPISDRANGETISSLTYPDILEIAQDEVLHPRLLDPLDQLEEAINDTAETSDDQTANDEKLNDQSVDDQSVDDQSVDDQSVDDPMSVQSELFDDDVENDSGEDYPDLNTEESDGDGLVELFSADDFETSEQKVSALLEPAEPVERDINALLPHLDAVPKEMNLPDYDLAAIEAAVRSAAQKVGAEELQEVPAVWEVLKEPEQLQPLTYPGMEGRVRLAVGPVEVFVKDMPTADYSDEPAKPLVVTPEWLTELSEHSEVIHDVITRATQRHATDMGVYTPREEPTDDVEAQGAFDVQSASTAELGQVQELVADRDAEQDQMDPTFNPGEPEQRLVTSALGDGDSAPEDVSIAFEAPHSAEPMVTSAFTPSQVEHSTASVEPAYVQDFADEAPPVFDVPTEPDRDPETTSKTFDDKSSTEAQPNDEPLFPTHEMHGDDIVELFPHPDKHEPDLYNALGVPDKEVEALKLALPFEVDGESNTSELFTHEPDEYRVEEVTELFAQQGEQEPSTGTTLEGTARRDATEGNLAPCMSSDYADEMPDPVTTELSFSGVDEEAAIEDSTSVSTAFKSGERTEEAVVRAAFPSDVPNTLLHNSTSDVGDDTPALVVAAFPDPASPEVAAASSSVSLAFGEQNSKVATSPIVSDPFDAASSDEADSRNTEQATISSWLPEEVSVPAEGDSESSDEGTASQDPDVEPANVITGPLKPPVEMSLAAAQSASIQTTKSAQLAIESLSSLPMVETARPYIESPALTSISPMTQSATLDCGVEEEVDLGLISAARITDVGNLRNSTQLLVQDERSLVSMTSGDTSTPRPEFEELEGLHLQSASFGRLTTAPATATVNRREVMLNTMAAQPATIQPSLTAVNMHHPRPAELSKEQASVAVPAHAAIGSFSPATGHLEVPSTALPNSWSDVQRSDRLDGASTSDFTMEPEIHSSAHIVRFSVETDVVQESGAGRVSITRPLRTISLGASGSQLFLAGGDRLLNFGPLPSSNSLQMTPLTAAGTTGVLPSRSAEIPQEPRSLTLLAAVQRKVATSPSNRLPLPSTGAAPTINMNSYPIRAARHSATSLTVISAGSLRTPVVLRAAAHVKPSSDELRPSNGRTPHLLALQNRVRCSLTALAPQVGRGPVVPAHLIVTPRAKTARVSGATPVTVSPMEFPRTAPASPKSQVNPYSAIFPTLDDTTGY